jgi:glycosyltransferase involved in cell wall biosynthesis
LEAQLSFFMANIQVNYVLITPVRDEQEFLPRTIASVAAQTILPREWVIVDDGSKDKTGEIIAEAARRYTWIRGVKRLDRGYRKWGAGIIEAFYDGYNALTFKDWDFMCKLDGDLSFEPGYFEATFRKFAENPKLGIGGGMLYHVDNGVKKLETHPLFHVRGGAKIYKRDCWDAMGGLWVGPGSDTLDEVKANMLGWGSASFSDILMNHHRWTGASLGKWGGIVKNGKTDYVSGYHPMFLIAKCVKKLFDRPYILGSLALAYGYVAARWEKMPQVDDSKLIEYLQRQQIAKLRGKETIWK